MHSGRIWSTGVVGLAVVLTPLALAVAHPAATVSHSTSEWAFRSDRDETTQPQDNESTFVFSPNRVGPRDNGAAAEEGNLRAADAGGLVNVLPVTGQRLDGVDLQSTRGDLDCPAGSIFGQTYVPDEGFPAIPSAVSSIGSQRLYDDFHGLTDKIAGITWWGLLVYTEGAGYDECPDPNGIVFEIRFYADNDGEPGEEYMAYTNLSPVLTNLGTAYGYSYAMYRLEILDLTPCCPLTDGWVSIQSISDVNCAFAWPTCNGSNVVSYLQSGGGGIEQTACDFALCLTSGTCPTVTGACCDRYTGYCDDGIEEAACLPPLQFTPGATCSEISCGITGACCDSGLQCLGTMVEADCDTADGVFYPGEDCASFTCPDDCQHSIVMYDCADDGWNGNTLDVLVNGVPVLSGITLPSGATRTHYFRAVSGDTIETVYNDVGSYEVEPYYHIYTPNSVRLASDGINGTDCYAQATGVTVTADCDSMPQGACCYPDTYTCEMVSSEAECVGGTFLGLGRYCDECPCIVETPPGAIEEGEPCGEDTNPGCYGFEGPQFEPLACGDVIHGTLWQDAGGVDRDEDWYQFTTTEYMQYIWTIKAEMPVSAMMFKAAGPDECTTMSYVISGTVMECDELTLETACLEPGTYWIWIGSANNQTFACPTDYVGSLTCVPCEQGLCAGSGYECREYITRVQMGTIDNESGCEHYGDFKDLSTDLQVGTPTELVVTNSTTDYAVDYCGVYIDYNRDFQITADEYVGEATGTGPYHFTIVPPDNTQPGPTTMRIRLLYKEFSAPCGVSQYGEVEDYTVNIVTVPGACCMGPSMCMVTEPENCYGMYIGPWTECDNSNCNGNDWVDTCEIHMMGFPDCDDNGILDECEPWIDCDDNGVRDACDLASGDAQDCNENGVLDVCDIANSTSEDCNGNGMPDECELEPRDAHLYLLDDGANEGGIGSSQDGSVVWLNHYQVAANNLGRIGAIEIAFYSIPDGWPVTVYLWGDPDQDGNPADAVVLASVETTVSNSMSDVFNVLDIPDVVVGPMGTHFFVGAIIEHEAGHHPCWLDISNPQYQSWLGSDPVSIDANNLGAAAVQPALVTEFNLFGNWGIRAVAAVDNDCNDNGIPDDCDIAVDSSLDCDGNLVIDACEWKDCNDNGILDVCDMLDCDGSTWCSDCNANGVPDGCDIDAGAADCQPNGIPDVCEDDCNANGIPDDCDIRDCDGSVWCDDCNGNGSPDECDTGFWNMMVYEYDDGSAEISIGVNEDVEIAWLSRFVAEPGCETIVSISTSFGNAGTPPGDSGVIPGQEFRVFVWDDPDGDGAPYDAVLLTSATGYVDAGSIDTDVLQTVVITPTTVSGSFFIGAAVESVEYPVPLDMNGTVEHHNWVASEQVAAGGFNPNAFSASRLFDIGYPGNLLLRATSELVAAHNDCNDNGIPDDCELCGDLDYDDDVDYDDYVIFLSAFGGVTDGIPTEDWCCDYDDTGSVGMADFDAWLSCYRAYVNDPLAGPPTVGKRRIRVPLSPLPKRGLGPVPSP